MNSTGLKTIVEGLQLAPSEERLLKRIVYPDPPGRFKSFFQRPLRGPKDVILAVLVLALGIALLWGVVNLIGSSLSDSGRELIFFIVVLIALSVRDTRLALQERLIKSLYSALAHGKPDQDKPAEQRRPAEH